MAMNPNTLSQDDQQVVNVAKRDGIAILPDLLTPAEVDLVRQDFDQLHIDLGKGPGTPGVRDSLSGDKLLPYGHVAALFSHPRLMAVVCAILGEEHPWAWQLKTNRYTPEHVGVRRHTDGVVGELSPPFARQSMAVFLDDIDAESGALTYVPGSHKWHFADPGDPDKLSPTQEQIDAGDYVPATLRAGSVVLRVPEVWHAVIPIHRLRRYVTTSYMIRGSLSTAMEERIIAERERRAAHSLDHVPDRLRPYYAVT